MKTMETYCVCWKKNTADKHSSARRTKNVKYSLKIKGLVD